ncbi:MAG: hypothetical protein K6F78_03425 [Bacteroidaceae bacterium]|nr:hypothetical protein [Bacteroidaceae bacterium]
MKRFRDFLKMENAQRLSEGRTIIEPFYPHDFLSGQSDDLANFVFLKTTDEDIYNLVNDKRNMDSRVRLMHYLDTDKTKAIVPDSIMQEFLQACIKYYSQFEIAPSISSIEAQDKVKIIRGPFAGYEASVVRVHLSHRTIHLDLAIPLISSVMHIRMCNVDKNQVIILDRDSSDAIRTDFIEYTQNHLLNILRHRIKNVKDDAVNRRDADMLTRLYRYRYHEVKNEAASNHFLALMLICAHLCRYTADEARLEKRVSDALAEINQRSESKAATDTRAYLWIALYLSTHNPVYRDAAKKYVQDYQPKSKKLRSFVSLIRKGKKV